MMDMRKKVSSNAAVVNAYLRVAMRRWLRKTLPQPQWPSHLWLDLGLDELGEWVERNGGDPEKILEPAREEIVAKIADREGIDGD